jgi:hypothetical protein
VAVGTGVGDTEGMAVGDAVGAAVGSDVAFIHVWPSWSWSQPAVHQ